MRIIELICIFLIFSQAGCDIGELNIPVYDESDKTEIQHFTLYNAKGKKLNTVKQDTFGIKPFHYFKLESPGYYPLMVRGSQLLHGDTLFIEKTKTGLSSPPPPPVSIWTLQSKEEIDSLQYNREESIQLFTACIAKKCPMDQEDPVILSFVVSKSGAINKYDVIHDDEERVKEKLDCIDTNCLVCFKNLGMLKSHTGARSNVVNMFYRIRI